MMQLGIFARTYPGPTLDETLDAIVRHQIRAVHFNLKSAGLETLPDTIEPSLCQTVRSAFATRRLEMAGLSGTFNAIHPDVTKRAADTERCRTLIDHAASLGADFISLCTGTRDATDMWRANPDNNTPEAWRDLLGTLEQLLPVAEREGITLGIEPERANVINTAPKARRLLDDLRSSSLKAIMDGANLFDPNDTHDMRPRLVEAFALLGPDIAQIHAKDIPTDSSASSHAAGTGGLDWDTYFELIARCGYSGSIVLHNLDPLQVNSSRDFVQHLVDRIDVPTPKSMSNN